ncbi:MAG: LysE family translocator [candidate division WOR-3 bacterium]|nr:MAG: LysE family translocator [candidate division WOR-3 bacterium]
MSVEIWLSFVGASAIFGLLPGPSVCFTIAYALKHGLRRTCLTILGQLTANVCQIVIVLFGINSILEQTTAIFYALKFLGAVYLIYLGVRHWSAGRPRVHLERKSGIRVSRKAFLDGIVVCGTNPKAILYYAALLPQFVVQTGDEQLQMIILAGTNIILAAAVLGFYTLIAEQARRWFDTQKFWKTQNRVAGVMMIGAGIALSLLSRK